MSLKQVFNPLSGSFDLVSVGISYNVRDYGATGNGTTNDTTAIQSAITAAQATGGIVFFPQGTYLVVLPQITTGGITLQGAGWKSKLLLADSTTASNGQTIGLWVNGGSNVIIRDLQIDGNFANIAKNGTYQTASTLWTPAITKYGAQGPKTYIYGTTPGTVDQNTYLTYRMPVRITNATNVIIENCLIQNSVSAGILIDATSVDATTEIMIRNNRVKLCWDNGIYFHKGVRYGSAIGNHCSDCQYTGVTAIYCNDIITANNDIHDMGPSDSDSAGIEYCGVYRGEIGGNTVYNGQPNGICIKDTNETNITNGFAGKFVKSYGVKIHDNHISSCHDPRYPGAIGYGINIRSADNTDLSGNYIELCDYGIQIGDVADSTVIQGNHVTGSNGWGITNGNSPDVTNTRILGNTVENGQDDGIVVYAPAIVRGNIVRNNAHQGIDLVAPPTGLPYKTDIVEDNVLSDNAYNGIQAAAGAGNLTIIKGNQFYNSDSLTYTDGSVTSGSGALSSAMGSFLASDVGAVVIITGAGSTDGASSLVTTITTYNSGTSVSLANTASITRSNCTFTVFRQKNVYFDGSMVGTTALTSATAKFTSADVGKTLILYSTDGPTPTALGTYSVSTYTSPTVVQLNVSPANSSNLMFVIKRNYGRQSRALFVTNSSDVHYENNRSWGMSVENYNKSSLSMNSFLKNNFDFGSSTSNQDPIGNPITPIADSQNYTGFFGQKDSMLQMNAVSGALDVYLPDVTTVARGTIYTIKKIDTSANAVTVNCTGSQLVDGSATATISTPKQSRSYINNGTSWQTYSAYYTPAYDVSWTTAPATATSTGFPGQKAYDSGFLYICTATNTWKRVAIASW